MDQILHNPWKTFTFKNYTMKVNIVFFYLAWLRGVSLALESEKWLFPLVTEYLLVSFLPNPILSLFYLLFFTITSVLIMAKCIFQIHWWPKPLFSLSTCVRSWRMAVDFPLNFSVLLSILLDRIIREQQTRLRLHWRGNSLTEILFWTTSLQEHCKKIVLCPSCWLVYEEIYDYTEKHKFG